MKLLKVGSDRGNVKLLAAFGDAWVTMISDGVRFKM
jgi:hypothetical protein